MNIERGRSFLGGLLKKKKSTERKGRSFVGDERRGKVPGRKRETRPPKKTKRAQGPTNTNWGGKILKNFEKRPI